MKVDKDQGSIYGLLALKSIDHTKMLAYLAMESMPSGKEQDLLTEICVALTKTMEKLEQLDKMF